MSVSDFDSRRLATTGFLTEGLGGKLTRSAHLLLRASAEDSFGDWKKSAITYACNWPNDRHVRHGNYQPNQVHRHNQHAHGAGEYLGGFGSSRSVEPLHKKE